MAIRQRVTATSQSNAKEIAAAFGLAARQYIPRATTKALNDIAFEARRIMIERMERVFHVRNKRWVIHQGLLVKKAVQAQHPKQYAILGHRDDYMEKQERGGSHGPRSGRYLAVPTTRVRIGKDIKGRLLKSKLPKKLLGKKTVAEIDIRGKKALLERAQRRVRSKTTGKMRSKTGVLYWLRTRVQVPRRLEFVKTTTRYFRMNWHRRFERQMFQAWLKAKRQAEIRRIKAAGPRAFL